MIGRLRGYLGVSGHSPDKPKRSVADRALDLLRLAPHLRRLHGHPVIQLLSVLIGEDRSCE